MNLADDIAALARQTVPELRQRYAALFGEATFARHKTWLVKRIAWRLQAVAEGELSERARQRALQLANDADLRLSPPKPAGSPRNRRPRGPRPTKSLPPRRCPMARRCRRNRRRATQTRRCPPPAVSSPVSTKAAAWRSPSWPAASPMTGTVYRSLSAVAKAITGAHCSGYLFFRLA